MRGGCWGCRIAIWALVLIIVALSAKALAASAAVIALAELAGVTAEGLSGILIAVLGISVGAATDWICCKLFGVCCERS